jgi:hypothetical protein
MRRRITERIRWCSITEESIIIARKRVITGLALSTKMIAKLLGDDERMVLEVYSHIVDEKENVAETINKVFTSVVSQYFAYGNIAGFLGAV